VSGMQTAQWRLPENKIKLPRTDQIASTSQERERSAAKPRLGRKARSLKMLTGVPEEMADSNMRTDAFRKVPRASAMARETPMNM